MVLVASHGHTVQRGGRPTPPHDPKSIPILSGFCPYGVEIGRTNAGQRPDKLAAPTAATPYFVRILSVVGARGGPGTEKERVTGGVEGGHRRTTRTRRRPLSVRFGPKPRATLVWKWGKSGHGPDKTSVCSHALGRLICPFYPKRTQTDDLG